MAGIRSANRPRGAASSAESNVMLNVAPTANVPRKSAP